MFRIQSIQSPFFLVSFMGLSFHALAQDKDQTPTHGKITISAGVGFGIHALNSNDPNNNGDGALTGNLRASMDYGISKRVALGLQLFRNGFAVNKDSNDAAHNSGIGAYVNYNFALRPKTIWYFIGGVGYSDFVYENFARDGKVSANGAYGSIGLGFRRYFGDYIGFFIQAEGTSYAFRNFEYEDGKTLKTFDAKDYRISINGVELKTGILIRL